MKTTVTAVGQFLGEQAKRGVPITYQDVIKRFPDLPPLTEYWKSHPLCKIFGELDGEDHRNNLPFRTALVCGKLTNRPGHGFFEAVSVLRGQTILEQEQDKTWLEEFRALVAYYRQS